MVRPRRPATIGTPRTQPIEHDRIDRVRVAAPQATEQSPRDTLLARGAQSRIVHGLVRESERTPEAEAQPLEVAEADRELVAAETTRRSIPCLEDHGIVIRGRRRELRHCVRAYVAARLDPAEQ